MENLISLRNVCFNYQTQERKQVLLNNLNFTLPPKGRVGLVGSNGSGKTTLLKIIMGLILLEAESKKSEIKILGALCRKEDDFAKVRPFIGFVFQDSDDQLFCPTVQEDIAFGPLNLGATPAQAMGTARRILVEIGLADYGERITYTLSGGEKKLVSLGTALAMQPRFLILDEPTAGLDEDSQQRLENILTSSGLPYLIVSHDRAFLKRVVNEIVDIKDLQNRQISL